ncbi:MAG: HlyD family type I secretion periplasmic adaptor subunit [Alsobacter sp.]
MTLAVHPGPAVARSTARQRAGRMIGLAFLMALLCVGGIFGWAALTEISGAVIAQGAVVVDSSAKKIQHQNGGIVGEILVREGSRVAAGDVLVRLDETVLSANLAIVRRALDELQVRQARLTAERDGLEAIAFPAALAERAERAEERDVQRIMQAEQRLFELRRNARLGQKSQLEQRIAQLQEEIAGVTTQAEAKAREIDLIRRELEGVRDLYRKNLIQLSRLTALEREEARLDGERGALVAGAAQAKGKVTETALQILQIDQDLRSETAKELREIQGRIAELSERRVTAEDQLRRVDIRAPQAGVVHQLAVHTVGGVVGPGELMMLIVPEGEDLAVEVKIPPQDIDQVRVGQKAMLRFTAFNQRTTPELEGVVTLVSADLNTDPRTGAGYFTARMAVADQERARLEGARLMPGMPVDAFVQTGYRSVLSYLLKPLMDQMRQTFRQR